MLLAIERALGRSRVCALWKKVSGWGLRAPRRADTLPPYEPDQVVEDTGEVTVRVGTCLVDGSNGEVASCKQSATSSTSVILGWVATAALDDLFEKAGIDKELGVPPAATQG